jgi:hypothetical protein
MISRGSGATAGTFAVLQPEEDQPSGQGHQPETGQAVEQYGG